MGLGIFKRPNYRIKKRVCRTGWRKPRGKDNKQRKQWGGYGAIPKIGYRKPKSVRNLHPSGLIDTIVYNVKDLENLDPKQHIIRIAASVGKRKKTEIVKVAKEKGFRIING